MFVLKKNRRARRPASPWCPFTPFNKKLFFLLVNMIPAPTGSHQNCLKCVKLMGKHFIEILSFSNFLTFFHATAQIAYFGRNCALPF
jgi:hypothetical protein